MALIAHTELYNGTQHLCTKRLVSSNRTTVGVAKLYSFRSSIIHSGQHEIAIHYNTCIDSTPIGLMAP